MPVVPIELLDDPRIADYRGIPDPELVRRRGLFVAEGRLVVRMLLSATGVRPRSVLVSEPARIALDDQLGPLADALPIYVASPSLLSAIAGFNVHRGCLALAERPVPLDAEVLIGRLPDRAVAVVLEGVGNADNVGGIFRAARALGASAVFLGPGCCDPLYRKATRVSVAATLCVPYALLDRWPDGLASFSAAGFELAAFTPDRAATDLATLADRGDACPRLALLFGAEGAGLSPAALAAADFRVRIPMTDGVDSLNVTTAVAVALHRFVRP